MQQVLGVLFGGRSAEHEVSVQSAASIWREADRGKYRLWPVAISKTGRWRQDLSPLDVLARGPAVPEPEDAVDPVRALAGVDVVFPVLHGPYGEDGTIQGLLEVLGLPYVGAGVLASSLCLDKAVAKAFFGQMGFPQGDYLSINSFEYRRDGENFLNLVESSLGFPCFVKPANMGSSVGINKVNDRAALVTAMEEALLYDHKVVVEAYVKGREIEVSVLGNWQPVVSLPGEIIPAAEFYDYDAKYVAPSQVVIPAPITKEQTDKVRSLALAVYRSVGCSGLARVDFFLQESSGEPLLNEINTIPGFTKISAYPKMWAASGLPYPDLIDKLVDLAFERHQERL